MGTEQNLWHLKHVFFCLHLVHIQTLMSRYCKWQQFSIAPQMGAEVYKLTGFIRCRFYRGRHSCGFIWVVILSYLEDKISPTSPCPLIFTVSHNHFYDDTQALRKGNSIDFPFSNEYSTDIYALHFVQLCVSSLTIINYTNEFYWWDWETHVVQELYNQYIYSNCRRWRYM